MCRLLLNAFTICILLLGCSNVPIYGQNLEPSQENEQPSKFPAESFVFLEVLIYAQTPKEEIALRHGVGSGVVVGEANNGGSLVLTAGHVCRPLNALIIKTKWFFANNPDERGRVVTGILVKNLHGFESVGKVVKVEGRLDRDLCILRTHSRLGNPVPLARAAPIFGEEIFNISAPEGIFEEESAYITSGFYSGVSRGIDRGKKYCKGEDCIRAMFSLRISEGCSGSPVMNERGELVSIVTSKDLRFNEISYGSTFDFFIWFVEDVIEKENRVSD